MCVCCEQGSVGLPSCSEPVVILFTDTTWIPLLLLSVYYFLNRLLITRPVVAGGAGGVEEGIEPDDLIVLAQKSAKKIHRQHI